MDFRVYYYGAQGVLDGTRPVYGETSGMGWPMHYRYPPPFLFIAAPFTILPLPWAAAVWAAFRCLALFVLIRTLWIRLGDATKHAAWLIPFLLAGAYVVEDLRYGNAQSFIFALTAGALLSIPAAPVLAGCALALAITIKVWPLFFVPYLAIRRQWKTLLATAVVSGLLLLLPSVYFGFGENLHLLAQWTDQEFATQTGQSEIWFPSQSMRGVLMRYLTVIDYTQVPDSNYPLVHVADLSKETVRGLWFGLAAAGYLGFLFIAVRYRAAPPGLVEGLGFASLILLEPFSQKYTLVVLLWPAMVAGRVERGGWAMGLIYAAIAIALVQPLIPGSAGQRLAQVLGFDFLVTALLAAFMVLAIVRSTERCAPG